MEATDAQVYRTNYVLWLRSVALYFSGKASTNPGDYQESHSPIFHCSTVAELCGSLKAYKTLVRSKKARPGEPDQMLANLRSGQNLHFFVKDIVPCKSSPGCTIGDPR